MATTTDVTRVQELTRELQRTAENAFGEDKEVSRQLALLYSVALMVGQMKRPDAHSPALVNWLCSLLEMLEDTASRACARSEDALPIYKAISRLQEALGVPEDRRAWHDPDSEGEADGGGSYAPLGDCTPWAEQAAALVPLLLSAIEDRMGCGQHGTVCGEIIVSLRDSLGRAAKAQTLDEYKGAVLAVDALLRLLNQYVERVQGDKRMAQAWGILEGIEGSLRCAAVYAEDGELQGADSNAD